MAFVHCQVDVVIHRVEGVAADFLGDLLRHLFVAFAKSDLELVFHRRHVLNLHGALDRLVLGPHALDLSFKGNDPIFDGDPRALAVPDIFVVQFVLDYCLNGPIIRRALSGRSRGPAQDESQDRNWEHPRLLHLLSPL